MGAINFLTSKIITLAIKPYDYNEIEEYIEEFEPLEGEDLESIINDQLEEYYTCDYENAKSIINKYDFECYKVSIESGYYESQQIVISFDWCYFDDWKEKRNAQKELTRLKNMLIELVGVGFVACFPSWCTSYHNEQETLEDISKAIKEERARLSNIQTWSKMNRKGA